MLLRRLNSVGITRFETFLNALHTQPKLSPPVELLDSEETSTALDVTIEIERKKFGNRLEAARYLDSKLSDSGLKNIERDRELWAWLSLLYFDELCPADGNGRRKPVKSYHYIPVNTDYRLYYRHLLAGPYRIYRVHRADTNRALVFLVNPLHIVGHFVTHLASKQEMVTNPSVAEAATRLYVDLERKQIKRGAVTYKRPGTVFRFIDILDQLDVTWDLYSMTTAMLLESLPPEFNRFKGNPGKSNGDSDPRVSSRPDRIPVSTSAQAGSSGP